MPKVYQLLFLSLISYCNAVGQYYNRYGNADTAKIFAINEWRYHVEEKATKGDSMKLVPDSIDVSINQYDNKIETTSFFRNSKTILKINYYFDHCELVLADVREPSPFFSDLSAFSSFYLEKDSIFYTDYHFSIRACMAIPLNKSFTELYGYNPNLSGEHLKSYVRELLIRIKSPASLLLPL